VQKTFFEENEDDPFGAPQKWAVSLVSDSPSELRQTTRDARVALHGAPREYLEEHDEVRQAEPGFRLLDTFPGFRIAMSRDLAEHLEGLHGSGGALSGA